MSGFASPAISSPASPLEPSPHDLAVEYLKARAIPVDAARRASIEPVQNAMALSRSFKKRAALAIPYFDPLSGAPMTYNANGEQRPFLRVRYLGDDAAKGFVKPKRKPQRFAQPKSSPVFAYFAPDTSILWRTILPDAEVPLIITEGELKGLCACLHGIPTVALGGVDSFRNNGVFLPELDAIPWAGRKAIICYDSDFERPGVQSAARRLASELKKRGAVVHLARLPNAEDGAKLGLDDVIARYGRDYAVEILLQAPEASEFETIIDLAPHRLVENLEHLDEALADSGLPIFQRSGSVVYVAAADELSGDDDVRRAADAPVIRELTVPACQQLGMRAAKFTKWNSAKKTLVPTECPPDFAVQYLNKVGGWRLPRLRGIVQAPTIREDGTILQTPGYDEPSRILYLPSAEFPPISETPTKDEAHAAYARLRYIVRGFEFASPESESVWISAVMTAVARKALRTAPLFAISAPVMGAGKTLSADLVAIIATGHEPAVMSQGRSPEEDRKRLLSVLMRGDGVTQIDNCEVPIEGDALCSILTAEEWQDRVLGQSRMTTVPTNTTFLATGNNLTFRGDMSTRALMCKLLPKAERPEEREFAWDARAEARAMRPRLVADVLRSFAPTSWPGVPKLSARNRSAASKSGKGWFNCRYFG